MILVLSEATDVFVLLVCWVYREEMKCKVQTERWDMTTLVGIVYDIFINYYHVAFLCFNKI